MNAFLDLKKIISKREFIDVWFKWIGYFLIVSTLIATGGKADSYIIQVVGYISGLALTIHVVSSVVDFSQRYKNDDKNAWLNAVFIVFLVVFIGLLIGSVSEVIEVALG